ncbi:ribokinase [Metarhizium acridum CQMa 102]|uniref:Ribokinase n=1 Tax=Metarhizium acridum (strain CQMa 102) TaxID=655827 RepID=E9DWX8_METAQ|nr:ribokinase [Metarhizium acridum CQMa 102]EFY91841.1 ribokinase [Metarhizium acridum CQMa 102]
MTPKTIAIIGGSDADLIMIANRIPNRGESVLASQYLEALGGKGANSAIATYRTCHKKSLQKKSCFDGDDIQFKMIGAVGDNRYVPNTRSSICFVIVEDLSRENRCLFTLGATATWKKEDFIHAEQLGGGIRPHVVVAQMEIDNEVVESMLATAAPASPISKRLYRHVAHFLVNESEAAVMSGLDRDEVNQDTWPIIAQGFLNRGVANVVITLGAKGAFYANNTRGSGHCPAFDVKVKDTTGAGDTFTGPYASDYLRQKAKGTWDIKSAVIRANKAAAITIESVGTQDGIPWSDEMNSFDALEKSLDAS